MFFDSSMRSTRAISRRSPSSSSSSRRARSCTRGRRPRCGCRRGPGASGDTNVVGVAPDDLLAARGERVGPPGRVEPAGVVAGQALEQLARRTRSGSTRSRSGPAKGVWLKWTVRRSGRRSASSGPTQAEVVVLHEHGGAVGGALGHRVGERLGSPRGTPPTPRRSGGRTAAAGPGRTARGRGTRAWRCRRRRRPWRSCAGVDVEQPGPEPLGLDQRLARPPPGRRRSSPRPARWRPCRPRAAPGPTPGRPRPAGRPARRRRRAGTTAAPGSTRARSVGRSRHRARTVGGCVTPDHASVAPPDRWRVVGPPNRRRRRRARGAGAPGRRGGQDGGVHVVAAPDKFRGTATAAEVRRGHRPRRRGGRPHVRPLPDGRRRRGHARGARRRQPHDARHRSAGRSGRGRLAARPAARRHRDGRGLGARRWPAGPRATTRSRPRPPAPASSSPRRSRPGPGGCSSASAGSATTDGGLGALRGAVPAAAAAGDRADRGLRRAHRLRRRGRALRARRRAPADAQVRLLRGRLERLAEVYLDEHGVDVRDLDGRGRGRRPGRRARRGRRPARLRLRGRGRRGRAVRPDRARRPGDHRRGLPRRRVVRRQGRRRDRGGLAGELGVPVLAVAGEVLRRRRTGGSTPSRWSTASARSGRWPTSLGCIEAVVADHLARAD